MWCGSACPHEVDENPRCLDCLLARCSSGTWWCWRVVCVCTSLAAVSRLPASSVLSTGWRGSRVCLWCRCDTGSCQGTGARRSCHREVEKGRCVSLAGAEGCSRAGGAGRCRRGVWGQASRGKTAVDQVRRHRARGVQWSGWASSMCCRRHGRDPSPAPFLGSGGVGAALHRKGLSG